MTFSGIPDELFQFYSDLSRNNDRDWWADHGHIYHEVVKPTMTSLVAALDDRWLPMSTYRPHRNVRFSPDKTPYKVAVGASGSDDDGVLHYVQLGESWLFDEEDTMSSMITSTGMYMFSPDQQLRYYDAVDQDKYYDLQRRMSVVSDAGFRVGGFQKLTTVPRGFSREHKRASLLRLGGVTVSRVTPRGTPVLSTLQVIDEIQRSWKAAEPVTEWLAQFVGPPDL